MRVYCLKYAESVLPKSMVFDGGNEKEILPISFVIYLIKSGDRNILVDAGCNTMPGFNMEKYYSPAFVLRQFDLTAKDITDVIITHSHHDHIEAVKHFKNAMIYITKSEYESGKNYIPENFRVSLFEKDAVISEQMKILECGGHSIGSSIVEIKTDNFIHILAGDECYTNENIKKRLCTGSFYNKEKSDYFINKYSDKIYRVHTCHDISLKTERII